MGILKVLTPQGLGNEKYGCAVGIVTLAGKLFRLGHPRPDQDGIGIQFMGLQKVRDIFRVVLTVRIQSEDGTATLFKARENPWRRA